MKLNFISVVVMALFFTITAAQAQENIIKLNVAALGFTNISLQDEYIINSNSSVALGVSFLPKRSIPSLISDKDSTGNMANIKFGGFAVTPEYRYYFSGNAPQGFYVAAYFRYSKYTLDNFIYNYTDDFHKTKQYGLTGDWTVAGAGIMIGSQWKIGDNFVFDWWILGGAFGKNAGTLTGTGPLTAKDQADIKKSIADVTIPVGTITSSVTSNSVSVTYDTGMPAIRGMGLCFGYIFGGGGGHSYHRRR